MCCSSFASLKSTLTPVNKDIIVINICIMYKCIWENVFSEMIGLAMLVYDRCIKVHFSEKVFALYKIKFSSFLCKLITVCILSLFHVFLCCITKQK